MKMTPGETARLGRTARLLPEVSGLGQPCRRGQESWSVESRRQKGRLLTSLMETNGTCSPPTIFCQICLYVEGLEQKE